MRLLMVTPMPPQAQPTNGVALVTYAQLSSLRQRHEITLVTVAGPDPAELAAVEELEDSGLDVHAVRRTEPTGLRRWERRWRLGRALLFGPYPFRVAWYREAAMQRMLDGLLRERHFDLIHLDDNAVGVYRYTTPIPLVYTEHEVRRPRAIDWRGWSRIGWRQWAQQESEWRRWHGYQLKIWQRFNRIIVFTQRDETAIRAIAPTLADRVRVNPFGLVIPPAANLAREQPNSIVFTGGFSHQPNVDAALWLCREIMPHLRALSPGVRLNLVGSFPPADVLALACDDIGVTGRVPAVEPFIEQAAVVLAPLRIGGGMRTKVLQGMAMGKAVVTTPLGAEGLLGSPSSPLNVQPPLLVGHDALTIAQHTAHLLVSTSLRRELGQIARAFVMEHYSAEAYARRLEVIYAELLNRA